MSFVLFKHTLNTSNLNSSEVTKKQTTQKHRKDV